MSRKPAAQARAAVERTRSEGGSAMIHEVWVAGYPSFYGGADTELDHNIDLWRRFDIDVHLVPMFGADAAMRQLCDERGCRTHEYAPGVFADKIVMSFCNGEFLSEL